MALTISIFEKVCSPYHYFLGNEEHEPVSIQPPTEKQIAYAKQLGVSNAENLSKQQLSEEINKAVKSGKK
jgi:Rho termination factor, N-terminal domain